MLLGRGVKFLNAFGLLPVRYHLTELQSWGGHPRLWDITASHRGCLVPPVRSSHTHTHRAHPAHPGQMDVAELHMVSEMASQGSCESCIDLERSLGGGLLPACGHRPQGGRVGSFQQGTLSENPAEAACGGHGLLHPSTLPCPNPTKEQPRLGAHPPPLGAHTC